MSQSLLWTVIAVPLFVVLCGCGQVGTWSEERQVMLYPVRGSVTLDGEPVAGAQVIFQPEDTSQNSLMAMGETDDSGRFSLQTVQTGSGAISGKHRVRISKTVVTQVNTNIGPEIQVSPVQEKNMLPEKYNQFDQSELTATVAEDAPTEVTFDLVSKP